MKQIIIFVVIILVTILSAAYFSRNQLFYAWARFNKFLSNLTTKILKAYLPNVWKPSVCFWKYKVYKLIRLINKISVLSIGYTVTRWVSWATGIAINLTPLKAVFVGSIVLSTGIAVLFKFVLIPYGLYVFFWPPSYFRGINKSLRAIWWAFSSSESPFNLQWIRSLKFTPEKESPSNEDPLEEDLLCNCEFCREFDPMTVIIGDEIPEPEPEPDNTGLITYLIILVPYIVYLFA